MGAFKTVLVVDPDIVSRATLRSALLRESYRVLEGGDGQEALALLRAFRNPVHLLITDLELPDMDGLTLASKVAARRPLGHAIIISPDCADVFSIHPDMTRRIHFHPRPFRTGALLARVRTLAAPGSAAA